MIDLTPETAGASSTAIRIAQRVLDLDGMAPVHKNPPAGFSLRTFCAAVARTVDMELNAQGEAREALIDMMTEYEAVLKNSTTAAADAHYRSSPAPAAARAAIADTPYA